jgi:hypothetical protein
VAVIFISILRARAMNLLMFTLLCAAAPALAGKAAATAKIFTDKGSTYFRTDNKKALSVGAELDVVVDAKDTSKPVGQAVVMEVNGALARISVDDDATKAGGKFVVLPTGAGKASPAAAARADDDEPKAPAFKSTGNKLSGKLGVAGLHFSWSNDSDTSWTGCKLVHSDGSFFDVGEVVKHTDDGVLRVKLGGAPEPAFDHVEVICSEGKSRFYFDKPSQPKGSLKGYARNDGGGIVLYNQMETAWTACDVRKPDGTHYVLGTLKGHSDDSIAKGRFKKEADNKPKWIEMRCKEGGLHTQI